MLNLLGHLSLSVNRKSQNSTSRKNYPPKKQKTKNAIAAWGGYMRTMQTSSQVAWDELSEGQKKLLRNNRPVVPTEKELKDHYKKMQQSRNAEQKK
jgi:hypothetical protein